MNTAITIPREPSYEHAQDYAWLRNAGMEHLQVLATKIWTDFNIHDPGITSLEALCFAITDLANRVALPVEDLIASAESSLPNSDSFHTAANILPCNPVTFPDFRKVVIDVPKVKNAWLKKAEHLERDIYVDCNAHVLTLTPATTRNQARLYQPLSGVFEVLVLLEDEVNINSAQETAPIIADIKRQLHHYRSLCEDFLKITILKIEEISLCADIEIEPESDADAVMAEVLFRINAFLDPRVNFYTIEDLLDKGKTIDQIFEGPLLQHGFIDEAELLAAERFTVIHTSDLYNIVMDIPGVRSVNKLVINNFINGIAQTAGERWCLHLKEPDLRVPRLMLPRCKVTFFKGLLPFVPITGNVENFLLVLNAGYRHPKLSVFAPDLAVPAGRDLEIAAYAPITNQFPMVYGIGPSGLDADASPLRQAQAKQMKAYLLFFEQVLTNYLAQLAHVKDLFAWSDSESHIVPSYYTQRVEEIKDIAKLYFDDYNVAATFQQLLQNIVETDETRIDRRNRFLEHLIGRFSERMVEYSLIKFSNGGLAAKQELVNDKARFLREYPILSRDRGKGFDMIKHVTPASYLAYDLWDSENITGLQRRAGRLLGIDNVQRRSLAMGCLSSFQVTGTPNNYHYELSYDLLLGAGPMLVTLTGPSCCSEGEAEDMLEEAMTLAADASNYTTTASPITFQIRDFSQYGLSAVARLVIPNAPTTTNGGTIQLLVNQQSGNSILIGKYEYYNGESQVNIVQGLVASIVSHTLSLERYCAKQVNTTNVMTITAPEGSEEDGNVYVLSLTDDGRDSTGAIVPGTTGANVVQQFHGGTDGKLIGTSMAIATTEERDEAMALTVAFFQHCDVEGMHIVEHILLRPKKSTDALMNACIHCPPAKPHQNITCGNYFSAVPGLTSGKYNFKFVDIHGTSMIRSRITGYASPNERNMIMYQVYEFGASYSNYEMLQSNNGRYYFNIRNAQGLVIAASTNTNFLSLQEANDVVDQLVAFFKALLNPFQMEEAVTAAEDPCMVENDPYSFRISVVLPGYAARFRDLNFRAFAERVIREETPAHIIAKICWVSRQQMLTFETEYQTWLYANAAYLDPATAVPGNSPDLSGLLDSLRNLSNYFPVRAKLHDCTQGNDENAIILNQSNLGNA